MEKYAKNPRKYPVELNITAKRYQANNPLRAVEMICCGTEQITYSKPWKGNSYNKSQVEKNIASEDKKLRIIS